MNSAGVLTKPQLPTAQPIKPGSDWKSVWTAIAQVQNYQNGTTAALQKYLNLVYQNIIPAAFPPSILTPAASPYTIGATDMFMPVMASASAGVTINLPQAATTGRLLTVAKIDSHAQNITLVPHGSDTINGASSYVLSSQYQKIIIIDAAAGLWLELVT